MKRIPVIAIVLAVVISTFGAVIPAQEVVDTVVAVVGEEIILLSELQKQLNSQMMARNLDFNSPREVLMKLRDEVLQGMIDDHLLIMKAQQDSITIDLREVDRELKNSLSTLKQRYSTEEEYEQGLLQYGLTEVQLRNMYRKAIEKNFLLDKIRMDMSRHISVTPQDIEGWITANRDSLPEIPEKFKISHILVYPEVSESRQKEASDKLLEIKQRILDGEDFAEMAKQYSQDPGTKDNGGFIDFFSRNSGYDPDFTQAALSLDKGEISDVVETIYGLHLIKCEDIRGDAVQARHILFRLTPNETDEKVTIEKMSQFKEDVVAGNKTFEALAKENSQDENSRDLGGKLDWITSERGMSDSGIPSFISNAKQMKVGDVSDPFKSQYGYHIIKLDGYQAPHVLNVRDDRTILENVIRNKKFIEAYQNIITELREQIYVDVRLN